MLLFLVHHGEAESPDVDPQRPLTTRGREDIARLADVAAARGTAPAVIWHSGKLRARQTAERYLTRCQPFAQFSAVRGLQPDDPPRIARDLVTGETRDVMLVGHMPHLGRLLRLLLTGDEQAPVPYPSHAIIALESSDGGETWEERWRIAPEP